MENAEPAFDAPVIAGEAVEVRDDGFAGERCAAAVTGGDVFQAIEAEQAEMLDHDAIHQQFFVGSAGTVLSVKRRTEALEDITLTAGEASQEEFVSGAKAVFHGIHAGLRFSFRSRGHDKKG